jgi:pilus assembly protein CpaB
MVDKRAKTETILRNLKVLAVDQQANTGDNEPVIVRAVTLEVTPPQSENLVRAREEGSIQLVLRNPLAEDPLPPVVVAKKPAPRKASPQRRAPSSGSVTVIRGMKVDTKKVKG